MNQIKSHHLLSLLNKLETKIVQGEKLNQEISKSNVAWHIEHSLLTINGVIGVLFASNPKEYSWGFNLLRMVVLTIKKIPRGRGKAPKVVMPQQAIDAQHLQKHVATTRNKIASLTFISNDRFFEHPYLGKLKLKQTISFLEIHTEHHLEIIEDITNRS